MSHLKDEHDRETDVVKPSSRFFCPYKCDLPPFRTMKLLLNHCQSVHEESLGKQGGGGDKSSQ